MDQNKINALIHLRECIDAMREGRDGDGQFSQKAYELIEELLAARAAPASEVVTWAVMFDGRVCYAPYDTETEANARLKQLSWPVGEGGRGYVAALALAAPSAPQEPADEECRYCDGCGWTEGGMTLMTDCPKCNGTGRVERK